MKPGTPPFKSARLVDQVKERVLCLHYNLKTEKAYLYWIRFFIRWTAAKGAAHWAACYLQRGTPALTQA